VAYGSETCYLVQEYSQNALLFCPRSYPRNLVVSLDRLKRTGEIENIFAPLDPR
jgi:hypothetical protein